MCCEIKYHHKLLFLASLMMQLMHEGAPKVTDGLPQSG